ncbi:antibiotic biosynthesis monooxygenase [Thermaurantimonas aggregans]|uniref:Antibiotic biosynthesis monooxygenase n=1 Tax=Thermaurantimonas aggregans TaxID=2173829 RepID=A0A401XMP6_9FLAO|nr:antibiotic biosynthesis monooxygenase [Thermaurantimonas aggregans]MCX8149417.1 antibiotic biosynthesis monooxygenase [Thermaurantimonas aggregans]GCD78287.1 antibiotic biosynthesis monooxygenase [Thermaurantimonas aggregans]
MIRIVKMTFRPETVTEFLTIFEQSKEKIRQQPGCHSLKLVNDKENSNVFFTISEWEHQDFLEQYRRSELFNTVWAATKALFADKPEAWSVDVLYDL